MALPVLFSVVVANQVLASNYFFFVAHAMTPRAAALFWGIAIAATFVVVTALFAVISKFGTRYFDGIVSGVTFVVAIFFIGGALRRNLDIDTWGTSVTGTSRWPLLLALAIAFAAVPVWLALRAVLARKQTNMERFHVTSIACLVVLIVVVVMTIIFGSTAVLVAVATLAALAVMLVARRVRYGVALLVIATVVAVAPLLTIEPAANAGAHAPVVTFANNAARPNVLWVIVDELQYPVVFDNDGNVRDVFPNLKALQQKATTYEQTYTVSHATAEAVPAQLNGVSMLRGYTPTQIRSLQDSPGIVNWLGNSYHVVSLSPLFNRDRTGESSNTSDQWKRINPFAITQVGVSAQNGIGLLAADAAAVLGRATLDPAIAAHFPAVDNEWGHYWESPVAEDTKNSDFSRWLDDLTTSPVPMLALWHYMSVHYPLHWDFEGHMLGNPNVGAAHGAVPGSNDQSSMQRRLYLAGVIQFDRQLGKVLTAWRSRPNAEQSMIIITADHGRGFEPTAATHRGGTFTSRWSETAHVPLIVKYPGQTAASKVEGIRSTGQIARSVLDAAGVASITGVTVAPNLDQKPPALPNLLDYSDTEPERWFGTVRDETPNPWKAEDLNAATSAAPYLVGFDPDMLGKPVPASFTLIDRSILDIWPGESHFDVARIKAIAAHCASRHPGLVSAGGRVIGSIVWSNPPFMRGWSIYPRTPRDDLRFWCAPE